MVGRGGVVVGLARVAAAAVRDEARVGADAPHALQPLVQRLPQPQGGWGGLVRVLAGCKPIYGRRERERNEL